MRPFRKNMLRVILHHCNKGLFMNESIHIILKKQIYVFKLHI